MNAKTVKGYLFAVLSAVIFGSMPLMAKLIYADGVTPLTLVFLRNFLALPFLAALALTKHKTLKITLKTLPSVTVISFFGCTLTPILLFSSYKYIASGTATVFHFVYPAVVVLASMLFPGKKVHKENFLCAALCVAGIFLFYDRSSAPDLKGGILALSSGVCYALYVLLLPYFNRSDIPGFVFSFYVAAISAVMTFVVCVATNQLLLPSSFVGWLLALLFAFAITAVAVVLFQQGAFLIGGERVSILSTIEPITSITIGAVVFKEAVEINIIIGAALVISASILIALFDIRRHGST